MYGIWVLQNFLIYGSIEETKMKNKENYWNNGNEKTCANF